jgi:hypothetical protein
MCQPILKRKRPQSKGLSESYHGAGQVFDQNKGK